MSVAHLVSHGKHLRRNVKYPSIAKLSTRRYFPSLTHSLFRRAGKLKASAFALALEISNA